ncbi:MAG TPA: PEP-CTERM sorting domain-containing protein [Pyrinomonadaceae bacterium]|nr:PEP-CTERM sorting domain-containing protein [Pyrinomonadaceae bacterium]
MRNLQFRLPLSIVTLFSILTISLPATAAPVKFEQVRQLINAKPGKAGTAAFSHLRLAVDDTETGDDKDNKEKGNAPIAQPQDDRVITTTTIEIVQDEVCDCVQEEIITKGFPKFALLGLAVIPLLFLIPRGNRTPTPTRTVPTTETPTPTTQTPTPTTPTPTPTTPTPTPPEPVPEPMTILLFGTGLASIGMAARKRLGKKDKEKGEQ